MNPTTRSAPVAASANNRSTEARATSNGHQARVSAEFPRIGIAVRAAHVARLRHVQRKRLQGGGGRKRLTGDPA
jgi:hypothetical protein